MGVYSEVAKKAYLESDNLYGKHTDDYYKSKMFYGYAEVLIDAKSDSEAKYFETRAINDFDVFKTAYRERTDKKLNGIVVRPVGEANDFVACYTDPDTKSRLFETVRIINGKVESCTVRETAVDSKPKDISINNNRPRGRNRALDRDFGSSEVVLSEGAKEIFNKAKEFLKKILNAIIDKLDSLLSKFPNSKFATKIRELLGKAKTTLNKTKDANSAEEIKEAKQDTDDLNKKCQDLDEEIKKAKEDLEKEKQGKSEEDKEDNIPDSIKQRHAAAAEEKKKSMENMNNIFNDIDENQKEINKLFEELDDIMDDHKSDSKKGWGDIKKRTNNFGKGPGADKEPIDVEYKEVKKESYNLAIDF